MCLPCAKWGSDNDIDMPVGDLELGLAQGEAFATGMATGLQIEFPAMPRTDDVLAVRVVLQHPGLAVVVHRLAHPMVDAALAHRPTAMGALIVPGDQLAIDIEDADFSAIAGNYAPLALRQFADPPDHERLHRSFLISVNVVACSTSRCAVSTGLRLGGRSSSASTAV